MIDLKVNRINSKAKLPSYAHETDAGLDLYSIEKKEILPNQSILIRTGIRIELPKDTEAQIRPRSGMALEYQITVLNSPGTIDYGYTGEIGVILINHGGEVFTVEEGMRIAQLIIKPILRVNIIEIEEFTKTSRGEDGFGSSGDK